MLIKELKEILNTFPDDADIIVQKSMPNEKTLFFPVISTRKSKIDSHLRLVLINNKSDIKHF